MKTRYCGIDVSAKSLTVAIQRVHQQVEQRSFPNNSIGHKALIVCFGKPSRRFEGRWRQREFFYSLDLAFALDAAEGIEVAVLNPRVANRFAQTIRRSKTDAADAEVLAEYARRMPFTAWVAPSPDSMRLRSIVRHSPTADAASQRCRFQFFAHSFTPSSVCPASWRASNQGFTIASQCSSALPSTILHISNHVDV